MTKAEHVSAFMPGGSCVQAVLLLREAFGAMHLLGVSLNLASTLRTVYSEFIIGPPQA